MNALAHDINTDDRLLTRRCLRISTGSSLLVITLGFAVLVGWATGFHPLMAVLPGFVTMKPNAAVAFCLAGACLFLFTRGQAGSNRRAQNFSTVFAAIATLIGALTLVEYLAGWNLGIDELLFRDPASNASIHSLPGRPAPITAFNLFCLGLALILIRFPNKIRWAHLLTGCAAFTSHLAFIGYFYGVDPPNQSGHVTSVALLTAVAFLPLCVGVLCATSRFGIMQIVTGSGTSGLLVRRYGLAVLVLPFLFDWLQLQGENRGWYGAAFGSAVFALVTAVAFGALIWIGASSVRTAEGKEEQVRETLRQAYLDLERRVVERTSELLHSNETLQMQARVIESMTEAVIVADEAGLIVSTNPACVTMFGYERGELIGQHVSVLRNLDEAEGRRVTAETMASAQGGVSWSGEVIRRRKDGTPIFVRAQIKASEVAGQRHFFAVQEDITERKQAEEQLLERVRLAALEVDIGSALTRGGTLAEILRLSSEAIVKHLDGAFARIWTLNEPEKMLELQASAGLYTHLDGSHGRIPVGKFKIGLIAEERRPHLTNQVVGDPRVSDQDWAKREGMGAFAGYPLLLEDRLVGVIAMFARHSLSEVTLTSLASIANNIALGIERKRAEELLRDSEEKFHQLADNITDVFWIAAPDLSAMHFINAGYEVVWGRSMESLYAHPHQWIETIVPEDRDHVFAVFGTLRANKPAVSVEYRIARPDGTVRWVHARGFQVRDAAGKLVRLTGIASDITERKQIEVALQQSEARTNAIVQSSLDCIVSIDHEGKILEFNPAAEKVFGHTRADVLGRDMAQVIVPPALRDMHRQGMARYLATGDARVLGKRIEITAIRSDGNEFPFELAITRMGDEMPPKFTASIRDITERKKADAALENAQQGLHDASRQAGMAEVATSVLHNVGNVLNSVNISATMAAETMRHSCGADVTRIAGLLQEHRGDLPTFLASAQGLKLPDFLTSLGQQLVEEQTKVLGELQSLGTHIDHIKEIVEMQQTYARRAGLSEEMLPDSLVEDALRLNAAAFDRHGVEVIRDYGETSPMEIDKHKVLQILVNLVRNAKYAMDEPGAAGKRMTLRIRKDDAGFVNISVCDEGVGIPAENLTRIFAHGFTTRKDGHGFGLHSAALAAREMGGSLSVHSDGVGSGATFTLALPLRAHALSP